MPILSNYFEQLLNTYEVYPESLGVGGYINNEIDWEFVGKENLSKTNEFYFDGWKRKDSSRFQIRKNMGLDADCAPGLSPLYAHGRSVSFLPPSNKVYEVEMLMGGVSSFRKSVFKIFQFSTYFEGYGLYEDADFSIRALQFGKNVICTKAQLEHHHDAAGRPNQYAYGKMVVRNGWYVWRVKNPKPSFKSQLKWHAITLLLTSIRATNVITTSKRKEAFTETMGRVVGWVSLFWNRPR